MTWNKWIASAALVPTMALGIGCASTPAPAAESLNARSSIRAAQELHAENQPQARYYLALAQEQIVKAELVRVTKETAGEYGKNWGKWLGEK